MDKHREMQQLISAYFDGELNQTERQIAEDHLLKCETCQQYFKDLSRLSTSLKGWNDESLSPDLEQKIRQTLQKKSKEGDIMRKKPLSAIKVGGGILVGLLVIVISMKVYQETLTPHLPHMKEAGLSQEQTGDYEIKHYVLEEMGKGITQTVAENKLEEKLKSHNIVFGREERFKTAADDISSQPFEVEYETTHVVVQNGVGVVGLDKTGKMPGGVRMMTRGAVPSGCIITAPPYPQPHVIPETNTESYDLITENAFLNVKDNPLSTFSIDVDTASYANLRRYLNHHQMPPVDAVRIEEMINYFTYDYPNPENEDPFSVTIKGATCPWNTKHQLALIGLQGKSLSKDEIPPSNLVFLIDVSGSMNSPNKLPLLKSAFRLLVNQIGENERVAIVVYAGAAGEVLESTPGANKQKILNAIDNLHAGGSTAGGAGIQLAYEIAQNNFIDGGNNRIILATDGDFNVGISDDSALVRIIEEKRQQGIFLSILGFGTGNYKDSKMEKLADKGNGNYAYIDSLKEAKKVLVQELGSTLFTIAKDVKIQIEFNPSQVKAYRLIGYENRLLAKEDFNDDTKDAGELGAGHSVTALYEIVPVDSEEEFGEVDELSYQKTKVVESDDLMTVKLRYKKPDEDKSQLLKRTISANEISETLQGDFQFVAAVAEFGLMLRNSKYKENASYDHIIKSAESSKGEDRYGYRNEFIGLVKEAQLVDMRSTTNGIQFKGK